MTSDDQFFFDYLASIPHDVRRYSLMVADEIDRHVDNAATVLRDTLSQQEWLPSSVRPSSRTYENLSTPSQSLTDRIQSWVLRNQAWTAAALAFVGTGSVLLYGSKRLNGKRRKARRAGNGARKEIVVVAGSPHETIVRTIASDLERRGFIVYITVSSEDEVHIVRSENRLDMLPLWLDFTVTPSSPSEIHPSLRGIRSLISQPQSPSPGVSPHVCQLSGIVLVPSLHYTTGPVATIPPSTWADTINARLLSTILTAQLFLPLLTLRNTNSTIVLAYPSISSSLSAPFAGPEVATTRALSGFATSLRRELRLLKHGNIDVVELRLGNVDLGSHHRSAHSQVAGTEVLAWSMEQRALYGPQYLSSIEQRPVASVGPSAIRGTPARNLNYAVFDALESNQKNIFGQNKSKKDVVYVGRGARSYRIIADWVPGGLVGWMLGLRSGRKISPESDGGSNGESGWEKL